MQGNKVRVRLQFRGRENAHREIGFEVLQSVALDHLKDMATCRPASPALLGVL